MQSHWPRALGDAEAMKGRPDHALHGMIWTDRLASTSASAERSAGRPASSLWGLGTIYIVMPAIVLTFVGHTALRASLRAVRGSQPGPCLSQCSSPLAAQVPGSLVVTESSRRPPECGINTSGPDRARADAVAAAFFTSRQARPGMPRPLP